MVRHFGASPVQQDRTKIWILIISLLGLFLVILGALLFSSGGAEEKAQTVVKAEPEPEIRKISVLIPVEKILAGSRLEKHQFRKEMRPVTSVPESAIGSFEEIARCFAMTLILPGQPITGAFITEVKPMTAIHGEIPQGYRAVTIRVNATTGVEGWARAGSRVDISLAASINGMPAVKVIVQNAKVLSAERNVSPDTPQGAPVPSTVTILVTARDAQKIQLAKTAGTMSLSLRGENDSGGADTTGGITIKDLLGSSSGKKPQSNIQGTVTIDGKEWFVGRDGSLIPAGGGFEG